MAGNHFLLVSQWPIKLKSKSRHWLMDVSCSLFYCAPYSCNAKKGQADIWTMQKLQHLWHLTLTCDLYLASSCPLWSSTFVKSLIVYSNFPVYGHLFGFCQIFFSVSMFLTLPVLSGDLRTKLECSKFQFHIPPNHLANQLSANW